VHRSFLTYAASVVQVQINDAGKVQINARGLGAGCGYGGESGDGANQFEGAR